MAQANTKFQVKRTTVAGRSPNTTNSSNTQYINPGEFALNLTDQILYSSDGTNLIEIGANNTNQKVTGTLTVNNVSASGNVTINNNVDLNFKALSGANVSFIQQSDDNFVFYSTSTTGSQRAVWAVFANSNTSSFSVQVPTIFNANINIGTSALTANGTTGTAGQFLTSNGSAVYWSSAGGASVNVAAQYTWTNTQTFAANISFTGNNISLASNTGAILFAGSSDNNWKIGRNTGATTKFYYTNNTLDIVAAGSNLEGFVIGQPGGNTYLETGYAGTFTKNPIYVGNATVNATINSTSFTGTSNNTLYVGSVTAANVVSNSQLSSNLANYQTTAGLSANVATLAANNASYLGTVPAANYIQNSGAYTISGVHTHSANIVISTSAGIVANGTIGTANQVLTSNGSSVYWSTPTGGASVTISDTAPSSPSAGNLWYSSATGDLYIYYNDGDSSQWVSVNETYLGAPVNTPLFTGLATFSNGINVVGNVTYSNVTFTNMPNFSNSTLTNVIANGTITANGTTGTAGYVLASGGSSSNTYWVPLNGNLDYGLITGSVTGSADYGSIL